MGFSTQVFVFFFFPICFGTYWLFDYLEHHSGLSHVLKRVQAKDVVLVLFSLAFYMWACFDDLTKLVLYIFVVYTLGLVIQSYRNRKSYIKICRESQDSEPNKKIYISAIPFVIAVIAVVMCLVYFKYSAFLSEIVNYLFRSELESRKILAPLGISFITFSAISYLTDIYRGHADAGSLIDCALFLSFFPKVVSGPIVLWKEFNPQILNRSITLDRTVAGLNRIMIGFAKKVILADQFGACIAQIDYNYTDSITAFGTVILYTLQIYYDFAGYSDIAIGLATIFGFDVKENFNFPYRSKSISEFWRRWHISLGTWFREYVYFPLGGSRVALKKTLRNLGIVFLLTGIWHGASWNYIIWGCLNGFFVILERLIQNKPFYKKIPNFIKHILTMIIVMLCWQLFRFEQMATMVQCWKVILGIVTYPDFGYTWQHFYDTQIIVLSIVGIVGATVLGSNRIQKFYHKMSETTIGYGLQEIVLLVLFFVAILFMVNSTYSPFLYFQY